MKVASAIVKVLAVVITTAFANEEKVITGATRLRGGREGVEGEPSRIQEAQEGGRTKGQKEQRNLQQSYLSPYGVFSWLDRHDDDTPDMGLSCVIRQANGYNGGRVLTAKGNDVVVQGRDYNARSQRWIIRNRKDFNDRFSGRHYNIWAQNHENPNPAGRNYLGTTRSGNTGLWINDDGSGRQRWAFDWRNIKNRQDHQFTIEVFAGSSEIDLYQEYLSNWSGNLHHVELASRAQVDNDKEDAMVWELIDCYKIPAPRFFTIRQPSTNRVLDVHESDCNSFVIAWEEHGDVNQQFFHGENGSLMSRLCNKALVRSEFETVNGSRHPCYGSVRFAEPNGSNQQSWSWSGNGPITMNAQVCNRNLNIDPDVYPGPGYAAGVVERVSLNPPHQQSQDLVREYI